MIEETDPIALLPLGMDIYLIDQLMRGHINKKHKILDAGCGSGRNMQWLLRHGYQVYGIDASSDGIRTLKAANPHIASHFCMGDVASMPFDNNEFDYIISSAVLHFAKNETHFRDMMQEMLRVLKPGGTLFIRMATDKGISDKIKEVGDGIYDLPDGSKRFLLTDKLLQSCLQHFTIGYAEPIKTVNVNDQRCMCTLIFKKLA